MIYSVGVIGRNAGREALWEQKGQGRRGRRACPQRRGQEAQAQLFERDIIILSARLAGRQALTGQGNSFAGDRSSLDNIHLILQSA